MYTSTPEQRAEALGLIAQSSTLDLDERSDAERWKDEHAHVTVNVGRMSDVLLAGCFLRLSDDALVVCTSPPENGRSSWAITLKGREVAAGRQPWPDLENSLPEPAATTPPKRDDDSSPVGASASPWQSSPRKYFDPDAPAEPVETIHVEAIS